MYVDPLAFVGVCATVVLSIAILALIIAMKNCCCICNRQSSLNKNTVKKGRGTLLTFFSAVILSKCHLHRCPQKTFKISTVTSPSLQHFWHFFDTHAIPQQNTVYSQYTITSLIRNLNRWSPVPYRIRLRLVIHNLYNTQLIYS